MRTSRHPVASVRRAALPGIAALALAAAGASAQPTRVGENVRVLRPDGGRSVVEPHLAVHPADPRHLLAVAIATPRDSLAFAERQRRQRCVAALSRDGGRTWAQREFPVVGCYDPWVVLTPDGQAVASMLGTHPALPLGDQLLVFRSPDGGTTWDSLPTALGRGHDHPTLVVDPGSSPARRGWVYLVSTQDVRADAGRLRFALSVARSRTGGRTFDAPVRVVPTSLNQRAETPAVLSDGTLVVSYVDGQYNVNGFADDQGYLARRRGWILRSADAGATFSMPLFATEACGPPRFQLSALAAGPAPAGEPGAPTGDRLYFACPRHGGGALVLSASGDGGEQWTAPVRVHAAAADSAVIREMPALAVTRAGVLGVAWVDTREDPGPVANDAPGARCFAVYFAASLDGGRTFLPERRVSQGRSCPHPATHGGTWLRGGDYFGMVAAPDGSFRLLWADARADGNRPERGRAFGLWTATVSVAPGANRTR